MAQDQLTMVHRNLGALPEIEVPAGYALRTYLPGDERAWARIMNTGVGKWKVGMMREKLTESPMFAPDGLFFATFRGKPVGSACAWRKECDEPGVGHLHMVCVLPAHRGKRLGHMLTLAVLHWFRDRGFREVVLSTDDHRIPAIKSYLRLGFEPNVPDDSHRVRWGAVFEVIGNKD